MTENQNNRYANKKVYKLVDDDGYYYYGSTCLPQHKRYYYHKRASKTSTCRKLYSVVTYERLQNVEIKIFLAKLINFNTKEELLRVETIYIYIYWIIIKWSKMFEFLQNYWELWTSKTQEDCKWQSSLWNTQRINQNKM